MVPAPLSAPPALTTVPPTLAFPGPLPRRQLTQPSYCTPPHEISLDMSAKQKRKPASEHIRKLARLREAVKAGLVYESNPRHKAPWQAGRRGSLCPREITVEQAQDLLNTSILHGRKRYTADRQGRPFCARAHEPAKGRWHGYPVGWKEVPVQVQRLLLEKGLVTARQIGHFWEGI